MKDPFEKMREIDRDNMIDLLMNFHEQLVEGVRIGESFSADSLKGFEPESIVLCGMGGSAIGGDFLRCYLADELTKPFLVIRDYDLPAFVNSESLVIASSYSGNTEETISAFNEAFERKAKIIGISTGGMLERLCAERNIPFLRIPSGLPPRSALGYSFAPLLVVLNSLGLVKDKRLDIKKAVEFLRAQAKEFAPDSPQDKNLAKRIALELHGHLPIIYTTTRHFEVVGIRFRGQINENAKMLAYSAVLPENNHNELVGWKELYNLAPHLKPVIILDSFDHPRNIFRAEFIAGVMTELGVKPIFIHTKGENLLTRMLSVIQLGDFVSYYLAILNGIDPKPVQIIDRLKKALAEFRGSK